MTQQAQTCRSLTLAEDSISWHLLIELKQVQPDYGWDRASVGIHKHNGFPVFIQSRELPCCCHNVTRDSGRRITFRQLSDYLGCQVDENSWQSMTQERLIPRAVKEPKKVTARQCAVSCALPDEVMILTLKPYLEKLSYLKQTPEGWLLLQIRTAGPGKHLPAELSRKGSFPEPAAIDAFFAAGDPMDCVSYQRVVTQEEAGYFFSEYCGKKSGFSWLDDDDMEDSGKTYVLEQWGNRVKTAEGSPAQYESAENRLTVLTQQGVLIG